MVATVAEVEEMETVMEVVEAVEVPEGTLVVTETVVAERVEEVSETMVTGMQTVTAEIAVVEFEGTVEEMVVAMVVVASAIYLLLSSQLRNCRTAACPPAVAFR